MLFIMHLRSLLSFDVLLFFFFFSNDVFLLDASDAFGCFSGGGMGCPFIGKGEEADGLRKPRRHLVLRKLRWPLVLDVEV